MGDGETETSFGRGRRVSAGRRKTRGRRAGDERETRAQNAGDDGETVSKTKDQNAGDEGETVSPETSFRNRETSSARLPLSPRTLRCKISPSPSEARRRRLPRCRPSSRGGSGRHGPPSMSRRISIVARQRVHRRSNPRARCFQKPSRARWRDARACARACAASWAQRTFLRKEARPLHRPKSRRD